MDVQERINETSLSTDFGGLMKQIRESLWRLSESGSSVDFGA